MTRTHTARTLCTLGHRCASLARWPVLLAFVGSMLLSSCGGGGGSGPAADLGQSAASPRALGTGIGSAGPEGVTVTSVDGARAQIPAGFTSGRYTVTVARDSEGVPALPDKAVAAGATYKLTPHGATFAYPVPVTLPFDPATAPPKSRLVVFKGDPAGGWTRLEDVHVIGREVTVFTRSFSYFVPMWVGVEAPFPFPVVATQAFVAWQLGGAATTTLPTAVPLNDSGNPMTAAGGLPWPRDTLTVLTQPDPTQPLRLTLRAALPPASSAAQECGGTGWEYVVQGRHARFGPTEVDQGGVIYAPVLARLRPPLDGSVASVSFDVNLGEFAYEQDPYGSDSRPGWLSGSRVLIHPDWPSGLRLEVVGSCVSATGVAGNWLAPVATGSVNLALRRGFPNNTMAFLQHPSDLTVVEGQAARFDVRVILNSLGAPAGDVAWQRSYSAAPDIWIDLPWVAASPNDWGASTPYDDPLGGVDYITTGRASLSKNSPSQFLDDQGLFRARVCPRTAAASPCVYSRPARLTVTRNFVAPQVVLQPATSVTVRENIDNEVAQITASFSGLPQPVVSWQVRQPGAQDFVPVDPATHSVSGNTLTVRQRFTLADRGRTYQAVGSNGGGVAISQSTSVWVTTGVLAPTITTQPQDITVTAGGAAILAAAADGGPPLNYQWSFNGQPIAGANGPLLALNNVNAANAGAYLLEVRNAENTVRSRTARLSVSGSGVTALVAPSITVAPEPQSVTTGSTAVFAVVASGTAPLAIQWQRNGVDIAGATGTVLTLAQVGAASAGNYSVRVSNAAGVATSASVALIVQTVTEPAKPVAPTIKVQPFGLAVIEGQGATLAVAASGTGPLRYQWFRDGRALLDGTEAALVFPFVASAHAGRYEVTVSNDAGSVTSAMATLVVSPAPGLPAITQLLVNQSVVVGQPLTFRSAVTGSPAPQCQWTRNGIAIPGATDCGRFDLAAASLADHGVVFNLVAYNPAGAVFGNGALLAVTAAAAPAITTHPTGQTVMAGGTAVFSAAASGAPAPTFEWGLNGGLLPTPVGAYSAGTCSLTHEASGATLTLRNVSVGCNGTTVAVQARNAMGTAISNVVALTVLSGTSATLLAGSPGTPGSADGAAADARFNTANYLTQSRDGALVVGDFGNSTIRVLIGGTVSTLAGSAGASGFADGTGAAARFAGNGGLAFDSLGNLFVSDWDNHVIRRVTPAGVVTTFAGSPGVPGSTDGTGAAARLRNPNGLAIDAADNVYVVDWGNHTLRKITPAGVVSTLAGSPGAPGAVDGSGATARFNTPGGLAIDGAGNLYVTDMANHAVRKVTPAGVVSTLAGQLGVPGTVDGTGGAARFDNPAWIAALSDGTLFVVSAAGDTVRRVTPAGVVSTVVGVRGDNAAVVTGADPRLRNARGVWASGPTDLYVVADHALLYVHLP